jgi:8-oxo-dGTP pyrophosphatase MutT (NUDIX family)
MIAWKTRKSRYILKSEWLNLREDAVETQPGRIVEPFYVVEYPDWVCVLPVSTDGSVIMVEQYRHGIGLFSMELPAGMIDRGEAPLDSARRELKEETGFEASAWTPLGWCAPEPSKHTNRAHVFLATDLVRNGHQDLDEAESIQVHSVPAHELDDLIEKGRIIHGVHLYALMLARGRGLI